MTLWRRLPKFLCVAAATIVLSGCDNPSAEPAGDLDLAKHSRGFPLHKMPQQVPALVFQDGQGRSVQLSDFTGKVVVLNVWATWCGPCRKEMPTLDRLQGALGGADLEVVALSVDHVGPQVVRDFYRQIGVKHLRLYIDPSPQTMDKLKLLGLPATLVIDRKGRELGRLLGAAEWDSPEMLQFFRAVIDRTAETHTVSRPPASRSAPAG